MPSSDDDIRWPWESSENGSPPQPRTPQNSPHSSGKHRSTTNSFVVQTGTQRNSRQPVHDSDRPDYVNRNRQPSSPPYSRHHIEQQNVGNHPVIPEVFVHEMLQTHNKYRALHQAPPLKLDRNLTDGAQHWAEVIASQEKLEPDMDVKNAHIGENLAMKFNSNRTDFSGTQFTDYWYSGISDYDFENNTPRLHRGSGALSFTQMVWKNSSMVGFGRAVSRRGRVYVVGRYFPGGNSVEGFTENVLPAVSPAVNPAVSPAESHDIRAEEQQHPNRQPSNMATLRSTGSQMSEHTDPSTIGAMRPTDTLVSTSKSTDYQNDRTVVTFEEKYRTPDGSTYTRQKKTTYYGEQRHHD